MKQAWSDWMEVLYAAMCQGGLSLSRTDFDHCCHEFFGKVQPVPENDGLTVFERRIRRLGSSLGLAVETTFLQGVATRATNAWQAHVRADPTSLEVLAALRPQKTLALISNFDHPPHAYRILRETGLDRYFETIVISGDVGVKKPDPEIFRIALAATGLSAEDVVYVGDTQEDVEGATAARIRPILIARPADPDHPRILDYTRRDEQASEPSPTPRPSSATTVNSLHEVLALLGE